MIMTLTRKFRLTCGTQLMPQSHHLALYIRHLGQEAITTTLANAAASSREVVAQTGTTANFATTTMRSGRGRARRRKSAMGYHLRAT